MHTNAPTAPPAWTGWVKAPGSTWKPVCEGRDHAEVWDQLLGHVTAGTHVERLVLRSGETPGMRRPRR
jgi:hypothetical protein